MASLVAAAGRVPGDVVIEVPSVFRDPAPYLQVLQDHRAKGFGVAVSGFGGRSGLSIEGLARIAPSDVARAAALGVEHVQGFAVRRMSRRAQSHSGPDLPRLPLELRGSAKASVDGSGSDR